MKYIGILLSIIVARGVWLLCGWLAVHFGATMTPAEQTDLTAYITGALLVAMGILVETWEKVIWPPLRERLKKWWSNKFPPTINSGVFMVMLFALATVPIVSSCGTLGSVTLGVGLGNGLCAQVKVEWDDKTETTEQVNEGTTIEAAVDAVAVKVNKKPVKITTVGYACDPSNADVAD